jgi:hypothetical protein
VNHKIAIQEALTDAMTVVTIEWIVVMKEEMSAVMTGWTDVMTIVMIAAMTDEMSAAMTDEMSAVMTVAMNALMKEEKIVKKDVKNAAKNVEIKELSNAINTATILPRKNRREWKIVRKDVRP